MRVSPGVERSTFSCSSMISDSTSVGAEARHLVLMVISGRVISGVISTGRRDMLMMPKMTTRIAPTAAATGFARDRRVRFIGSVPCGHPRKAGRIASRADPAAA